MTLREYMNDVDSKYLPHMLRELDLVHSKILDLPIIETLDLVSPVIIRTRFAVDTTIPRGFDAISFNLESLTWFHERHAELGKDALGFNLCCFAKELAPELSNIQGHALLVRQLPQIKDLGLDPVNGFMRNYLFTFVFTVLCSYPTVSSTMFSSLNENPKLFFWTADKEKETL